jgi:hypothetical protein
MILRSRLIKQLYFSCCMKDLQAKTISQSVNFEINSSNCENLLSLVGLILPTSL